MTRLSVSTVIKAALFVVIGVVAFSLMSNTLRSPVRRYTSPMSSTSPTSRVSWWQPGQDLQVCVYRVADIDLVPQDTAPAGCPPLRWPKV